MLLSGDEIGRSQQGNNNAYCQDNERTWLNWDLTESNEALLDFVRQLIYFRRQHPAFRRRKWFQGRSIRGSEIGDLSWYNPDGGEMTEDQWNAGFAKAVGIFLNGDAIATAGKWGERVMDDSFLLFFNAHYEMLEFTIPPSLQESSWFTIIDTTQPYFLEDGKIYQDDNVVVPVEARSLVVLQKR
jgi:glycogen operon protein